MEYLKKKFSVYMTAKPDDPVELDGTRQSESRRWHQTRPSSANHEYIDCGGMCMVCTLDRIGHDRKHAEYEASIAPPKHCYCPIENHNDLPEGICRVCGGI